MNNSWRVPIVSSLLGGAVAAVVVVAVGGVTGSHKTTTVIRQSPVAAMGGRGGSAGLTARDIYRRDAPGVAFIRSQISSGGKSALDLFGLGPQRQRSEASGSGFVIDRKGNILTNAHVVEGASSITASFEHGSPVKATVVGRDPSSDLALLHVEPKGLKLTPLELGSSAGVEVGDPTIAIGNPFGLDRTLTTGVVSALQRRIDAPNGFSIDHVIQTDAAINPGNSGGPLLDASGRVIGINSQIATGGASQTNIGIGFAVPIDTAKQDLARLSSGGTVKRAYLGISGVSIDPALNAKLPVKSGALIGNVVKGGPADKAGIKGGSRAPGAPADQPPLGGDIVQSIGGKPVRSFDDVSSAVNSHKPGDKIQLGLLRGSKKLNLTVTLSQRPAKAPA